MPARARRRAGDAYISITSGRYKACARPRAGKRSSMGRGVLTTVLVAAFAAAAAPAYGSSDPANVPWETFLPAMPASAAVQPRSVPYCRRATVKCIDTEINRLRGAQTAFGCDHRGV